MFSDHRVVEIEACPALIGLPQPQKHFNLNCSYLAWGGSWGGEAMIEVCVCVQWQLVSPSLLAGAGNMKILTTEIK